MGPVALDTNTDRNRLRVDVEIVLRSEDETVTPRIAVTSKLAPGLCAPSCTTQDGYSRSAYRTSVEILNSGFMSIE